MSVDKALTLSVKDIIRLMDACREHGVSQFHGGGVTFSLVNDPFIRASPMNIAPAVKQPKDFDQMLIEDPRAYEEAMREID
jgi:hypothetical protein